MPGTKAARLVAFGLVGLVTFGALLQRLQGLKPASLWLDDQWVAALATVAPVSLVLTGEYPCPPGFILLLRALIPLTGFGELQLQMIPFVAGLAAIPLLGWVTTRATGSLAFGVIAAVLIAGNQTLAVYGLRVKPYSVDALATATLLALTVTFIDTGRARNFASLAATAAVMPLFSFPSLLIGGVLVNFLGVATLFQRGDLRPPSLSRVARNPTTRWMIAYNLAALVIYLSTMRGRGNAVLYDSWISFYLPVGDPSALASFLATNVTDLFTHSFPETFPWLAIAFPIGLLALMLDQRLRILGVSIAAIYAAFFVASALGLYPIGERRTDAFISPLTIFTAVASLALLRQPGRILTPVIAVSLLLHFALGVTRVAYTYPNSNTGAATIVERANTVIEEEDGLIVFPWTSWAVGIYGRWPLEFDKTEASSNAFYVIPARPHTLVVRESWNGLKFNESPTAIEQQLIPFLQQSPDRLFYIIDRGPAQANQWIIETVLSTGYRLQHREEHNQAMLMTFER